MAKQERARQTRHSILIAAATVFETKGFDAATVSDIVREAATTKGGLYFHFDSKESLARAVIEEQGAWLSAAPSNTGRPLQEIIDISFIFSDALRNDPLLRASIRLTVERGTFQEPDPDSYRQWEEVIAGRIAAAQELGQVREHWTPLPLAQIVTGSVTGLQLASEVASGRADLDRRLETFWAAVLPGVATSEHLAELRVCPPSAAG